MAYDVQPSKAYDAGQNAFYITLQGGGVLRQGADPRMRCLLNSHFLPRTGFAPLPVSGARRGQRRISTSRTQAL